MFSVGNSTQRSTLPSSHLRFGFAPTDFTYTGNLMNPERPDELEFSANSFVLNYESPGFDLYVALANNLSGLDNINSLDIGLTLSNNFFLVRQRGFQAGIPIQLYSSITNVNSDRSDINFNQANFGIGGGGFVSLRFGRKAAFTNQFLPGYGFSSSSGGFFGGSMFYLQGKSRLYIYNVIGGRALSVGYDFNFRSFDVDQELYDFDRTSHTITLGISL